MGQIDTTYTTPAQKEVLFGKLRFCIVGKLFMDIDQTFTITPERAVLLEKKLLKILDEFVSEA